MGIVSTLIVSSKRTETTLRRTGLRKEVIVTRIAGTLSCSLVNGNGVRYVIFCQGCAHHCIGCQNPETWDFNGGKEVTPEELAEDIKKHKRIDGITLSGEIHSIQQEECVSLLKLLPHI